jgi:hypothetical protein
MLPDREASYFCRISILVSDTEAFVVRIRPEFPDAEQGGSLGNPAVTVWRGSIVHVRSNRRLYFIDLAEISRFIQEETGLSPISPRPPDEEEGDELTAAGLDSRE